MSRYSQGAAVEREVAEHLGSLGYDVVRSAGSKGGADLIAFTDDEMCFVQVKKNDGQIRPYERAELLRLARRAGAYALVAHKITDPHDGRRKVVTFRELKGTGPRQWQNWVPQRKEDATVSDEHRLSSGGTDQGPDDPEFRPQHDHTQQAPDTAQEGESDEHSGG